MKFIVKNSIFFGTGMFIYYNIYHFLILSEEFSLKRFLFILIISIFSALTWGIVLYYIKKEK